MEQYLGITISPERDKLFDDHGLKRLKESYMCPDEISPQQRFAKIAKLFGSNAEHSQRLYDYASNHWVSFSTPILAMGKNDRSLPISCYLNYIDDSAHGLVDTLTETNWLTIFGGGVGIGFGIRAADSKSTGVMPHLKTYDSCSEAYKQGETRRGSYAVYLDISHPDILLFLDMRKPTGDPNLRCANLHHGINIPSSFMEKVEKLMTDSNADDDWQLVDPHSKQVVETVSVKYLWQKILELRMQTGEPYIHFIDTSNTHLPQWLKDKGLSVKQSNLCTEIILPTSNKRTAVCCLSSLNLEYYDQWKDNKLFVEDIAEMLDNVLTYFIENAPKEIPRAKYSAMRERSIGIGALGFHAYLQQNNIPFECALAKSVNIQIFKTIRQRLDVVNKKLAIERGECPDGVGHQIRFSHLMAIAPNATSSIIMGNTSPSVEPYRANTYRQDTTSGSFIVKNKYLNQIILDYCKSNDKLNYEQIWSSIISNDGSCQHLSFLTEDQKNIFKTAMEIDQRWIIEHAADRQKFIDQGQSINVFFRPNANIKYIHAIHFLAWKMELKTLYYCRSEKIGKADKVAQRIERQIMKEIDFDAIIENEECLGCK